DATREVEARIEPASGKLARLQGGDDEARVGLVAQPLRLGDHAPPPRPALERRPEEVLVAPGRPRRAAWLPPRPTRSRGRSPWPGGRSGPGQRGSRPGWSRTR